MASRDQERFRANYERTAIQVEVLAARWRTGPTITAISHGWATSVKLLRKRAVRIILDVGLLVGFAAEFVTREGPNYDPHSWIGIILVPVICVHLASNWRWVTSAYRRRGEHPEWQLAKLNAAFSAVTMICILSGFPIWLEWSDSGIWSAVHNVTGFVSVGLAVAHLWRNRQRLSALMRARAATSPQAPTSPQATG